MRLVMFDLDGTLTDTQTTDGNQFVHAIHDALGITGIDTDWASYGEVTSGGVLDLIVRAKLGHPVSRAEVQRVRHCLVAQLAGVVIHEIPGAAAFLTRLRGLGCALSLASGDWKQSARYKLAAAGIPAADLPAAFSDDSHVRTEIMQRSVRRAQRHYRCASFDQITYVGDGSWDVRAARALGWGFIGIGSGKLADHLRALGAGQVFPDFRQVELILSALAAARPPP